VDDDDFVWTRPIPSVSSRGIDHAVMPGDYKSLLEQHGPGTLAGVLRLLSPDGPEGFNMAAEQARRYPPDVIRRCREKFLEPDGEDDDEIVDAPPVQIWGILETGESLWWQPVRDDPAKWLVVVIGNGSRRVFEDEFTVFPGTLTELIIAAMTYTHGIHLGDSAPGDPRHWPWPFWGPDAP
jgi:hypothetical protein